MQVESQIRDKLIKAFQPQVLEVINESHRHSVPANSETHFKILVVSDMFNNLSRIDRQRQVHELLREELQGEVHALSQMLLTPEEWTATGKSIPKSPPCLGGSGRK